MFNNFFKSLRDIVKGPSSGYQNLNTLVEEEQTKQEETPIKVTKKRATKTKTGKTKKPPRISRPKSENENS